ncbi:MAG TPA: Uma2 family endonuclease [Anaerolineae bacterium]|nr:Uma2 family endonuclease [Anaerolineae bacterium]
MRATTYSRVEVAERMTAEEFWRDASETHKAELIDGVMIMPSPASRIHENLFGFLYSLLRVFVEEHSLGVVLGSRTAVELAIDQVYEPDILFIRQERSAINQEKGVFGAPDFVIEILSMSTAQHDRGTKLKAYERAGVREYWIIDPYGPAGTEFYQLQQGSFLPILPDAENRLHSSAVEGFVLDVRWLWNTDAITVKQALDQISDWNQ